MCVYLGERGNTGVCVCTFKCVVGTYKNMHSMYDC